LSLAAMAGLSPGFSRWAYAHEPNEHASHVNLVPQKSYAPVFFTTAEFASLDQICEMILPADASGPGAHDAGAAEFIDFMVAHDTRLQRPFREGLALLDTMSTKQVHMPFAKLDATKQKELLERLAYRAKFRKGEERGQIFFVLLRKYTVMGFYTSETGYKALDSPNLKFYASLPGCPHHDDPEHRHLTEERARA